jgi:hypothetical protein
MQFFIGLKEFTTQPVFDPSLFVEIRKRAGNEVFNSLGILLLRNNKIIYSIIHMEMKNIIKYLKHKAKNLLNLNCRGHFTKTFLPLLDISVKLSANRNYEYHDKLFEKKIDWQSFNSDPEKLRIAAFGTDDDWRRNGIWAACRKATDFQLFEVPDGPYPKCKNEKQEQEAKRRDFLAFIRDLNLKKPVTIALFSHSGRHISNKLLEDLNNMGIWTIIMSVDDKHQFLNPVDKYGIPHQLRVAGKANLYWTNWEGAVPIVFAQGGNPWFAPPAADPRIYHPTSNSKDIDIVFVGGCYGARKELVDRLRRWFHVEAFGTGWPNDIVSHADMIALFGRSKIVLGISGVGDSIAVQTLKGRDFEVPMCGTAYLTSFNSEYARCFTVGEEVACYGSIEDCVEVVNWMLKEPGRTETMGMRARERAIRDHTWDKRLQDMLKLCHPPTVN